jgi:hypothetical protein
MRERVNQFFNGLKQAGRQLARTFYSAHPLGAINEASELAWQQLPDNFKNANNNQDYRLMRHAITWPSLLVFSWYFAAWHYLFDAKSSGFLSAQAIFMRDFINKLYNKNQPAPNPYLFNALLTMYSACTQPEDMPELFFYFLLNKAVFTLTNPPQLKSYFKKSKHDYLHEYLTFKNTAFIALCFHCLQLASMQTIFALFLMSKALLIRNSPLHLKKHILPTSHQLENHMDFLSILFVQSIRRQALLGKISQWLAGNLQGGFSLLSFLMFALNAAAKEVGDHSNATLAPFALLVNAACIFAIKQCFSNWNKASKELTDKQLRTLYLLSFVTCYAAFQLGTEFLYNLMRPAKHYCMTYPDTSQPMFFTLESWSLASWNKINVSATISWTELPKIYDTPTTAVLFPYSNLDDSPHRSAAFCTVFNLFRQNHSRNYCSDPQTMPTPMT